MKTILDPSFRYTPSFNTDLKKTFARIRRGHRQDREEMVPAPAAAFASVSTIVKRSAGPH